MRKEGFILFYALLIVGVISLMAFGVSRTALNEVTFSSLGKKSQQAFFAANSGLECALYWDLRRAQFLPSSIGVPQESSLLCAGEVINFSKNTLGTKTITTFEITNLQNGTCADVLIEKEVLTASGAGESGISTRIVSDGKDTCDPSARSLERSIRVRY